MSVTAYPLAWPPGWKRTSYRTRARFVGKTGRALPGEAGGWSPKQALTIAQATQRVMDELKRFGVPDWNIIISTNLDHLDGHLRKEGAMSRRGKRRRLVPKIGIIEEAVRRKLAKHDR